MSHVRKQLLKPGKRYSFKFYYDSPVEEVNLLRRLANDTQVLAIREILTRWGSIVVEFEQKARSNEQEIKTDYYVSERHRESTRQYRLEFVDKSKPIGHFILNQLSKQ